MHTGLYVFSLVTLYFKDLENTLCVFSTMIDLSYRIICVLHWLWRIRCVYCLKCYILHTILFSFSLAMFYCIDLENTLCVLPKMLWWRYCTPYRSFLFSLATFYFIDMENMFCVLSTMEDFASRIICIFTGYVLMYRSREYAVCSV